MPDPFDSRSVHGLWPLVADPGVPGGIRFAEIGRDAPEDCLASPGSLPDAGLELRTFGSAQARDAWCSALSEFGGNAVHATPLPLDDVPAALLVRFDRDRTAGTTLEDCIPLVGALPPHAASSRARDRSRRESAARQAEAAAAWSTELAALDGLAGVRLDPYLSDPTPKRLILRLDDSKLAHTIILDRGPAGRTLCFRVADRNALDMRHPDLTARMRAAAADLGYTVASDCDLSKPVPPLDAAGLAAAVSDIASLDATRSALMGIANRRSLLASATEGAPGRILRGLAAGFPLAKAPASASDAHQVNPASGHAVPTDGYAVATLWKAGAIRPAWWSARAGRPDRDTPLDAFEASVWVATALGLDLVAGARPVAELAERLAAERAAAWGLVSGASESPAFETLAELPRDRDWSPPEHGPEPRIPPPGPRRRLPKRAKDIAQLATWLVHGLDEPAPAAPSP